MGSRSLHRQPTFALGARVSPVSVREITATYTEPAGYLRGEIVGMNVAYAI